jgi:hypothetical protein
MMIFGWLAAPSKEEIREGWRPVRTRLAETPGNNLRKSLLPSFDITKS